MRSWRHRGIRFAGALLFAVLVLVPLVESGHRHADRDLARPCATCLVAHHSPAASTPTIAIAQTVAAAGSLLIASSLAPKRRAHSPRRGRAPPGTPFAVDI
jgi:hypothetical protein